MGFYAGAINNKKILSLNTKVGGDRNQHEFPDDATIFHSSMPHVLAEVYEVPLRKLNNGFSSADGDLPNMAPYYIGDIPAALQDFINIDINRVILTEIFYTVGGKEYSKLVQGVRFRSRGDQSISTDTNSGNWRLYDTSVYSIAMSRDINLKFGYYNPSYKPNIPETYNIGLSLAGDRNIGFATFLNYTGGPNQSEGCIWMYSYDNGGFAQDGWKNQTHKDFQCWIREHYNLRLNSKDCSSSRIYVATDSLRNAYAGFTYDFWNGTWGTDTVGYWESANMTINGTYPGINDMNFPIKSLPSNINSRDITSNGYENSNDYEVTPTKVRFIVTNLKYNGNNFDVLYNPFSNTGEILLKGGDFRVGGVNMSNMPYVLLNQVTDSPMIRNDINMTSCNQSIGNFLNWTSYCTDIPLMGSSSINGSIKRNVSARRYGKKPYGITGTEDDTIYLPMPDGTPSDTKNHQLSYYNFKSSNGWFVDTSSSSIGNQNGAIWSPGSKPLKLFTSNFSKVNIGQVTPITSGTGNHTLANINLGLDTSRYSTVLLHIKMLDSRFQLPQGGTHYSSFSVNQGAPKVLYTRVENAGIPQNGNNTKIDLIQLEIDRFVPFWTSQHIRLASVYVGSSAPLQKVEGFSNITIGLVKRSNGSVDVIALNRNSFNDNVSPQGYRAADLYVYLPYMQLTVQRLT